MIALYIIGAAALLNAVHMRNQEEGNKAVLFGLSMLGFAEVLRHWG